MPSCFTIWTQGAYAVVNHFFVPCWKNHEGGLPLGGFIWHQVPEVCTTLASLNQNWSKLTASPGMHPTALWHFLKTMRCSTCCSACLHVCLHNLIASQRTSSMCGPSWPLKDNSLSASSVCIFQAWVNGSQIWNTLKPWEPPPEPSCCPANTVHCWKSSIACRTPSNPAFKAPFKWKKSSTASRIRGKLFLAKRKLTGHLESPYKGGSSLLPTVPPCMKPLKTCRDPIPKAAKKTHDKPFGTHLLELLFGAQEFSPSTFLAPKK